MRPVRAALALGLCAASLAAHAAERPLSRGERLAVEGRCEAALPRLERELDAAPGDARVAWRLGQCALRLHRYARAAQVLEQSLAADPERARARLDLARARYHLDDLAAADAALHASESELAGDATWQLYRGMVDLGRGDTEAAVRALERARALDPHAVEPVASYYVGLALRERGEEERADAVLRGVVDRWAGTAWATEADRALRGGAGPERAWITVGGGLEYDDNVVLLGREVVLPEQISDEGGVRGVWLASGGLDLGRWGDTRAGVLASYRGRAHADPDLREFDSHFPTASLWVDQVLRRDTVVRLRGDFGYAWVDGQPFLGTGGGRLSLLHGWSKRSTTELFGGGFVDDYLFSFVDVPDGPGAPGAPCGSLPPAFPVCGPPGLDERAARDRDGWAVQAGVAHALALSGRGLPGDPSLRGGYTFTSFESDGRESSHRAHRFFLGAVFALPFAFALDLEGSYTRRVFRHPSTYPEQEVLVPGLQYPLGDDPRREDVFEGEVRLSRPLTDRVSATARYRYRDHRSTADVFDYDQHVVGLVLTVTLGRP